METLAGSQGTAKRNGNRIRFTASGIDRRNKNNSRRGNEHPTVAGCVGRADTVASLEIKLYHRNGDAIEEVTDDKRTKLLNGDTGDTLDAFQMKRAMVKDMFLDKGGYAFVHKSNGEIVSLHYVEANRLAFTYDPNPIFKDYKIYCYGAYYEGWQWIKLLRNTRNGYSGESIVDESKTFFETAYASLLYEKT